MCRKLFGVIPPRLACSCHSAFIQSLVRLLVCSLRPCLGLKLAPPGLPGAGFLLAPRQRLWPFLGLAGSVTLSGYGFVLQTMGLKEGNTVVSRFGITKSCPQAQRERVACLSAAGICGL